MFNFHIVIIPIDKQIRPVVEKLQSSLGTVLGDVVTAEELFIRYAENTYFSGAMDDINVEAFCRWVPHKTVIRVENIDHPLIVLIRSKARSIVVV